MRSLRHLRAIDKGSLPGKPLFVFIRLSVAMSVEIKVFASCNAYAVVV